MVIKRIWSLYVFLQEFLCLQIYSGFKVIEAGIVFTGNFRLLFGNYMVVIQTLFTNLFTDCDKWLVSSYFKWIVTGATRGTGNAHSFQNTWFYSLWGVHDSTHSLYIHYRICQSKELCLRTNDCIVLDLFYYSVWLVRCNGYNIDE